MGFNISQFGLSPNTLPVGWREDRLDSIADFNPEQVGKDYPHTFIGYLDISNVGKGTIGKPEFLALENAPSRAKRIVATNDTIISTVRPGNRAYAFLKEAPSNLIASTGFAVLRAKDSAARFLYYLSTSDPIIDYLASIAEEKTAYPSVNPGDIGECLVPIPPLPEQRAIAHILGTLDDKIELNRRMNETLEAMARTIFKSWFVDFDPVRAKAEGRKPEGMNDDLASLFPDSFQDSELGKIPKRWSFMKLGDIASLGRGLSYRGEYLSKDGMPMVNLGCFLGKGKFSIENLKFYSGKYKNGHILNVGDIVLANTDITQKREVLGSPAVIPPIKNYGHFLFTHHVFALRVNKAFENWRSFIFFVLLQNEFRERAIGFATGTTVLALPRDAVLNYAFALPKKEFISTFNRYIDPLFKLCYQNMEQSIILADIRDALLPKLLSGEIRIKSVNKFIGGLI